MQFSILSSGSQHALHLELPVAGSADSLAKLEFSWSQAPYPAMNYL